MVSNTLSRLRYGGLLRVSQVERHFCVVPTWDFLRSRPCRKMFCSHLPKFYDFSANFSWDKLWMDADIPTFTLWNFWMTSLSPSCRRDNVDSKRCSRKICWVNEHQLIDIHALLNSPDVSRTMGSEFRDCRLHMQIILHSWLQAQLVHTIVFHYLFCMV